MFEKILIPLDGSEFAEAALPYAEEIGRTFESDVLLLYVCPRECRIYEHMYKIYLDFLVQTLTHRSSTGFRKSTNLNIIPNIEEGNPLEALSRFVGKKNIDLVILTSDGASGRKSEVLGHVADHVIRTVKVPVLLIKTSIAMKKEKENPAIKRILVTLDGSDCSKLALPVAEGLANKLQIPITLFQMARDSYPYYCDPAPFVDYRKMATDEEKKVRAELSALDEEFRKKGQIVNWEVTSGNDAALEIIKMSQKLENCLLVMSTHGRSGFGRWALGSVAEKVLRHIGTPLLLVPARAGRGR